MRRHLEVFRRVLVFVVAQGFAMHSAWAADPDNPAEIRVRQVPESQVVAMGQAMPEVGAQVVYAFFPNVAYTAIVSRVAQVATGITAIRSETPDGRNTTCLAVISADGMRITVRDYDRRRLYQCVSLRNGGYECREYDLSRELPRVSAPSLVPPGRTGEKTETVAPFDSTGGGDSGVLPTATVYLDVMIVFDTAAQTWAAANR